MRYRSEIEKVLKNKKSFEGCFSSIKKLTKLKIGKTYMLHKFLDDDRDERLGHWTALKINQEGDIFFFDSHGVKPNKKLKKVLQKFVSLRKRNLYWSSQRIQSIVSEKCGEFAVLFIMLVKGKKSYKQFLQLFDKEDMFLNDDIVNRLLNKLIK